MGGVLGVCCWEGMNDQGRSPVELGMEKFETGLLLRNLN